MRRPLRWMFLAPSRFGSAGKTLVAGRSGFRVRDRIRVPPPDPADRMDSAMVRIRKVSPFVSESFLIGRLSLSAAHPGNPATE